MRTRANAISWRAFLLVTTLGMAACARKAAPTGAAAGGAPAGDAGAAPLRTVYPLEVRDDLGRAVTLRAAPRGVVSLLPSHTQTLFALGIGDRVLGVDDYSDDPPEALRLPKLGGLYDAHLEQILSLAPDLVLLSESSSAVTALEQSGLTVWAGSGRTFDDVFRVIGAVGKMVDKADEAARLSEAIQKEIRNIEQRLESREKVSVYYELDTTPYTVGPSSFVGVMLAKAGGRNVIPPGLGDFPKINPEVVIAGNPSIILGAKLEEVAARPGWNRIAAVQTGRVYAMSAEDRLLVTRPGPRVADAVRAFARRLHPDAGL
jgi:iron complex transport system substrate-binding protein